MSTGNDGEIPMSNERRPDTTRRTLHGLGENKPLGRCPGCTKWVLENDYHFRTTKSNRVWHARCAEGILDASSTLVRIVNVYAVGVERALLFTNAGRIGQGVKALEAVTMAVNTLMTDAGVQKMFPVPTRPQPYAVPPADSPFHYPPGTVLKHCVAGRDGECNDPRCPQIRDGEPEKTGRHCPIDTAPEED